MNKDNKNPQQVLQISLKVFGCGAWVVSLALAFGVSHLGAAAIGLALILGAVIFALGYWVCWRSRPAAA
jgi:hypothetical protein